jgi:hypothetical protein
LKNVVKNDSFGHIYVFFFEKNLKKLLFLQQKKKNQMRLIFIQKFNEIATKAKKIQSQLVYIYIFILILLPSYFLKKHRNLHSVKFFHRFSFGVKKHFTLHQFFFQNTVFF